MINMYNQEVDYYLSVGPETAANMIDFIFDSYRGVYSIWQSAQMLSETDEFKEKMTTALLDMTDKIQKEVNNIKKEASPAQKARINETISELINQVDVIRSQLSIPA